ncbi:glycosyltransferase family protein [Shewanella submarina]|uniref:Glycosyltransferase family protein n=1 Tax=Shewanella submarina TaxID=2016376 RepID=A0ABV7GK30_9GAMM|nr:glycosyltransferase family protein [Shewanella submarina]MCL1036433.1 glycosyltransferase family protein [Shewanella submarina]
MKVICITQARMGSTRLPGKILLPVADSCLLDMHMSRVGRAALVDQHLLAIASGAENAPLVEHCQANGYQYVSGSEQDVLSRFVDAARFAGAEPGDVIIRLTSDCPLICPELIDAVVKAHQQGNADYSYLDLGFHPRGFDTEVFCMATLLAIHEQCHAQPQREHVTLGIYQANSGYRLQNVHQGQEEWHKYRLCVDEADDLTLIRQLVSQLDDWRNADHQQICRLLDSQPELASLNRAVIQKQAH